MSISQAFSNASLGLTVTARASALVSSNVANALNGAYARREIELSQTVAGGSGTGVRVAGVTRAVDAALLADRRLSDASAARQDTLAGFYATLEEAYGSSTDTASLSGRVAAMESKILQAASLPQSDSRLEAVVAAAQDITDRVGAISSEIQSARADADVAIARSVDLVNRSLVQIDDLNQLIVTHGASGRDVNALLDQRQALIDGIAAVVPLKEIARDGGRVALYTASGAMLLDGAPGTLAFTPAPAMDAGMTLANGQLSGLTLNGRPVDTASGAGAIAGGSLAAQFAIRDDIGVAAQAEIDAFARNLVERFSDPATDATLAGAVGLFTDGGSTLAPGNETGLAARLSINALADPAQGGALWRIRDGLGAAAAGEAGNAAGLNALLTGLTRAQIPASGASPASTDLSGFSARLLSAVSTGRLRAESLATSATARAETLRDRELSNGVNQDDEMQKLLLIETTYAANAKVIQAVDGLLQTLLEI